MTKSTIAAHLFGRRCLQPFFQKARTLCECCMGIHNYQDMNVSGEIHVLESILPLIAKDVNRPFVFDIGANTGEYIGYILRSHPKACIHAFEPNPSAFMRLHDKYDCPKSDKDVSIYNLCVSDFFGATVLFTERDVPATPIASTIHGVITKDVEEVRALATTLDLAFSGSNLHIDLLKIDVEGAELRVIVGAERMIRDERIGAIQFEINEFHTLSRVFLSDFGRLLPNWEFFRLLPKSMVKIDVTAACNNIYAFQNILAISPTSIQRMKV